MKPRTKGILQISTLFVIGVAGTLFLDSINADLGWTSHFYSAGGPRGGWIHGRDFPWSFLYDYGELLGLALAVAAFVVFIACIKGKIGRKYARPSLVIILTFILGPGLLVNGIFKNYWGRPRPVEISQFGGDWEYRKVWEPGIPARGKSFPCGHCSMAVSLASGVALFPLHPVIGSAALIFGVSSGIIMGIARIAQGGHFPTDVLWSEVLILALIIALYYVIFRIPQESEDDEAPGMIGFSEPKKAWFAMLLLFLPSLFCLFYWPVYRETVIPIPPSEAARKITVNVSPAWVNYTVGLADPGAAPEIKTVNRGFGFPWARFTEKIHFRTEGERILFDYVVYARGFLSHPVGDVTLWLPCRKQRED